ncbi:unnamed protein product [Calypogeia fissa]
MEVGTVQFFVFLLIIILIKESWGNAESFDVSPMAVSKSGDTVTVSFATASTQSEKDALSTSTPSVPDHQNFIVEIASSSSPKLESDSGSANIPALNVRTPMQLRLFIGQAINVSESTPIEEDVDLLPKSEAFLTSSVTV